MRTKPDPKIAIAYLRVSTDRQDLGPEAQKAAIEAWAAREGVVIAETFEDRDVSGAAPFDKRPGLMAALEAIRHRSAGILVVAKIDRLVRDAAVATLLSQELARSGARVASADGVGNEDTPESALIRGIFVQFAQYERQLIRARTKAALQAKKRRGETVGQVPYGLRLAPDSCRLEPDPNEQAVLETMRTWRGEGLSFRAIVDRLNEAGIPARACNRKGQPAGAGPAGRWHLPIVWSLLTERHSS
jgi:DNA invertase Pin-like site-specific DNA recombinase